MFAQRSLSYDSRNPALLDAARVSVLTTIIAFIIGNAILMKPDVLQMSSILLLVALLIQFAVFYVSQLSGHIGVGLVLVIGATCASVLLKSIAFDWFLSIVAVSIAFIYAPSLVTRNADLRFGLLFKVALIGGLVIISAKSPVSFDLLDRLELGSVHRDTLFHASIASMIKSYGVISTGLSGLVETPYHVLSHIFIASISRLSGVGVLEAYGVIPLLLLLPLLLALYAYLAASFDPGVSYLRAYFITAILLAISPRVLKIWGLKESYFGSESYTLSLILLAPVLLLLFKNRNRISDLLIYIALAALAAIAKATVGIAVIGLFLTRVIFFSKGAAQRLQAIIALLVMCVLAYFILMPSVRGNLGGESVAYWEYVKHHSMLGEMIDKGLLYAVVPIVLFIVFHFLFNWIIIRGRLTDTDLKSVWHDEIFVYNLAAVSGAILIVMLPLVSGSAAYYFSGAAMFVALPWLVIVLAKKRFEKVKYPILLAVLVIIVFKGGKLLDKSALDRDDLDQMQHRDFVARLLALRDLRTDKMILRRDPDNTFYDANPMSQCAVRPFVYPAVTEIAWSRVIFEECEYYQYSFAHYLGADYAGLDHVEMSVPEGFVIIDY